MKRTAKWILSLALLAAVGVAAAHFLRGAPSRDPAKRVFRYDTADIRRGDVASTIAASGTIEPEELVDVGSQVSGKIVAFGTDASGAEVDYCSVVTNGMVLARIDDVTYLADLDVARAQQSRALANVESAKASEIKAKVDLEHARKDWERAQRIGVGLALSQSDFDAYQASYETAGAALAVATAAIGQAEAAVVEAKASVEKAERNLGYCTISAPVDGIVIDRRVNLGQTVVSSMSVSSLFLVAKDLSHMRIWAAVNEADVGQIREGQGVAFTVDAFPGRTFRGTVRRVRLNATITSNVVTYVVEIDCDNPDGTLLPYLTANVEFETATARGALVVPSRALKWTPVHAEASSPPPSHAETSSLPPSVRGDAAERQGGVSHAEFAEFAEATARRKSHAEFAEFAESTAELGTVWVLDDPARLPRPVPVKVLLNNGSDAAIEPLRAGELAEGAQVVTRATEVLSGKGAKATGSGAAQGSGNSNPFLPKMPRPPKRAGGPPPG